MLIQCRRKKVPKAHGIDKTPQFRPDAKKNKVASGRPLPLLKGDKKTDACGIEFVHS